MVRNRLPFRLSGVWFWGRVGLGNMQPARRRGIVARCRFRRGLAELVVDPQRSVLGGCNGDAVVLRGVCRWSSTSISPPGTRDTFRCRLAQMIRDEARSFPTRSVGFSEPCRSSDISPRYGTMISAPRAVATRFGKPDMPPFAANFLQFPLILWR